MKILLVHNYYRSVHVGGEDVVFRAELQALKQVLGDENVFEYIVTNDDLTYLDLTMHIWGAKKHANRISQIIKEQKINLVHVHNTFPQLTPYFFKAVKKAGATLIHTLHNFRPWCIRGSFYHPKLGVCYRCLSQRSRRPGIYNACYRDSVPASTLAAAAHNIYDKRNDYEWVDAFFYLSESQKEILQQCGIPENKLFYKPNFVPVSSVWPFSPNKEGILFVGRLEKEKGIDLLIQAAKTSNTKVYIIGSGQVPQALQELSQYYVLLGKKSHDETLAYIKKSRFVVQPSIVNETFGLTMLESFGQGTPVIGLNIGTRKEFIRHNENGLLCDVNGLSETLIQASRMPDDEYRQLSHSAWKSAQPFSVDKIIKNQIEQYVKLCQRKTRQSCH